MKNILLIAHNPLLKSDIYTPRGGAISIKEICEQLAKKCNVYVLQFSYFNETKLKNNILYITKKANSILMKRIISEIVAKEKDINLIVTWGHEAKIARYIYSEYGINYIMFVQRFQTLINGYLKLMNEFETLIEKKNSPYNLNYISRIKKYIRVFITFFCDNFLYECDIETAFKDALIICSNSKYTSMCIKKLFKKDSFLMYPTITPEKYIFKGKVKKEFITFMSVNLTSKEKDMFTALASRFPKEKFLLVGTKYETQLKNIYFQEKFTSDVRKLYAKTKIILRPRVIPEPFGRTPLEASVSGIPSIVTDLGGHSEATGKGGILVKPNSNIQTWEAHLRYMLNNYDLYSQRAREHFKGFYNEYTKKQMSQLIEKIIQM